MERKRNKIRNRTRLTVSVVILAVVLLACAFVGFKLYIESIVAPYDAASTGYVNVTIPGGASTNKVGEILEGYQLIRDASQFKLIARLEKFDGKLQAGEFTLTQAMTVREILTTLSSGNANTKRFTVPEGYTIAKTADKLENDGFIDREVFMEVMENGEFPHKFMSYLPEGPNRLEGFLFPETYDVFTTATEEDIINRMLAQFDKEFSDEYYVRADELGLSLYEVVIIASMVEAEARMAVDRPLISSVIYNRLSIGMPLQLDATVQYALGETKERLLIKDTQIESPYNTYLFTGLPPGPICSPGADCINAALYPADTDYIFYVLKPDGSGEHNFATNINDFNKFRMQYLNSL